jgi:magnesium-transporting ATPase (P-type)
MVAMNIVVGDVIEIGGGDKVPADLRILEASGLKVPVYDYDLFLIL